MRHSTRKFLVFLRVLSDLLTIELAWILAYFIRFHSWLEVPHGIPPTALYFKLVPFIAVIWLATFSAAGLYRRTGRHRSPFIESLDIIQCCFFAIVAFIAFTYFYEEYRYSRITMVIFAALHPFMAIAGRSVIRKLLRYYSRKSPVREVLVIGSGENLKQALHLNRVSTLEPSRVVGAIFVGGEEHREEDLAFCNEQGLKVFDLPQDWVEFFTEHPVQAVYIALPHSSAAFLEDCLQTITDQVYDVKLMPDLTRYSRFSTGIEMVQGVPVISIHESPMAGIGGAAKRLMDIVGAVFGILVFAPIMAVIAILVPLSSPGPILYRQTRMGLDGRPFDCLKFRSMPTDSEKRSGAVWATKDDNRATWLGRFLRRTSLDELPQLFNVLKGDMSLVGPRPERPVFVNQFRKQVPGYMLRHKVKAGMTGWAQVNGWRGNTSIEKRIECDLFYIQNWSLWLDVKILFKTVEEVFFGKNAY